MGVLTCSDREEMPRPLYMIDKTKSKIKITISYVETRFERASGSFAGCPTFCGFITKWWICQVEYDIIFEAKIREKCERGRNVPSKPH